MSFKRDYKNCLRAHLRASNNLAKCKENIEFSEANNKRAFKRMRAFMWIPLYILIFALLGYGTYLGVNELNKQTPSLVSIDLLGETENIIGRMVVEDSNNSVAKPSEEILIRITVLNPKEYRLDNAVINDIKYKREDFLEISTATELYLTLETPASPGLFSVNVSSMRYMDTRGSYVAARLENNLLTLGLTYPEGPYLSLRERMIDRNSYYLKFNLNDKYNLVKKPYSYYLFTDGVLVESNVISGNKIEINNLLMDKEYKLRVIISLDLLDGRGERAYSLYSEDFKTSSPIGNINVFKTESMIKIDYQKNASVDIIGARLILNGNEVAYLSGDVIAFSNLLSNTEYEIEIIYSYIRNDKPESSLIRIKAKTNEYKVPNITGRAEVLGTQLFLQYRLNEEGHLVNRVQAIVYFDNERVATLDSIFGSTVDMDGIAVNEIRIEITLFYDLRDGSGESFITYTDTIEGNL